MWSLVRIKKRVYGDVIHAGGITILKKGIQPRIFLRELLLKISLPLGGVLSVVNQNPCSPRFDKFSFFLFT